MSELCSICNSAASVHEGFVNGALALTVDCQRCGRWKGLFDYVVPAFQSPENARLMPYLAAHIRQTNELGETVVELTRDSWKRFAESHAHTPVPRKLDMLLRWFEKHSDHPGAIVRRRGNLFALVDAQNEDEVGFLCGTLVKQGSIEQVGTDQYQITAKGWERLSPSAPGGDPGTCFVAMSFDKTLDLAYGEGILPAVQGDCGFHVIRIDRVEHNDNINDRIIADLRAAQFVVADFSDHKNGVYFEAGFGMGLGRIVICTCREGDFTEAHFDTRPFNHILWSSLQI